MSTKPSSHAVRQLLRAAAPPALTLVSLLAVGDVSQLVGGMTTFETFRLVAIVLAGVWLTIATGMVGYRTRRDTLAHRRLQQLRADAQVPGRALVHVQTVVWSSSAGQQALVVNVATGHPYRLWLPEVHLPIGAFALLGQRELGVEVHGWLDARTEDVPMSVELRWRAR